MQEKSRIAQLVDDYDYVLGEAKAAERELSDLKKQVATIKADLIEAMLMEETESIGRNNKKYTIVAKKKFSKRAGCEEKLFQHLREQGLGDIITETVNANTLNAAVNALADECDGELPDEWNDCINTFEYTDISVRKS